MFDSHSNLAYGIIATPPASDVGGTEFYLYPGQGTLFNPNQSCTIFPAGTMPTWGNAEIGYITAVDGDHLTITRAQEGTNAKSASAGWAVVAGPTARTFAAIEEAIASNQTAVGNMVTKTTTINSKPLSSNVTLKAVDVGSATRAVPVRTSQSVQRHGVTYMTAVIQNPLPSTSYTNTPVGIRVEFERYEVPTADYIKVFNDSGTAVPFQWEGAINPHDVYSAGSTDPNKETDNSTYADGSLRAGSLWVMVPTLAANGARRYKVAIYDSTQSQSFAPALAYANVGGTSDEFTITNGIKFAFQSSQGYNLRRMYDYSGGLAGADYFLGQNGIYASIRVNGTAKFSYTAADIQSITNGRLSALSFGYGVVFIDYQTQFNWVAETGLWTRMRYRCFADGRLEVECYTWTTGALASNNRHVMAGIYYQTGATTTAQLEKGYVENVWASPTKNALTTWVSNSTTYEATPAGSHGTLTNLVANPTFGWSQSLTAAPAGAYWTTVIRISSTGNYAAGTGTNDEWLRQRNPIFTRATRYALASVKANFVSLTAQLTEQFADWTVAYSDTNWAGCGAMAILFDGYFKGIDRYAEAVSRFNVWLAAHTNSATGQLWTGTTSDFLNGWTTSNTGLEYTARNIQAAWYLYEDCLRTGRSATPWANMIHNFADFIVSAEALSSGGVYNSGAPADGNLLLRANWTDNFNAEAAGIAALARSLAISSNPNRSASMNRLITRFASGFEAQNWLPYAMSPTGAVQTSVKGSNLHYHLFAVCDALEASVVGSVPGWTFKSSSVAGRTVSPLGYAYERLFQNDPSRRGAGSTQIYIAGALALAANPNESDFEEACALLRHVLSRTIPGDQFMWETPMDGWAYNGGVNQFMDIRVLLAAAARILG